MAGIRVACPDDPRHIESELMCLYAVSKDLEGKLALDESEVEKCDERDCATLKTRHVLQLEVKSSGEQCDSREARILNGRLLSIDLASAFSNGSGENRGFHGATVRWTETGGRMVATGTLSGVTNAGPHRDPFFRECQQCDERGVMEGRLCAQIRRAPPDFVCCNVIGVYLLRFDANAKGGGGAVQGTFEGVIVCPCG
jgi:hypothetical protein